MNAAKTRKQKQIGANRLVEPVGRGLNSDVELLQKHLPFPASATSFIGEASNDLPPILFKSRFTHLLQREGVNCLFHALNLQMVYGGPILPDLLKAFADTTPVELVISQCSRKYPIDIVNQVIVDLFQKGLLVQESAADVEMYRNQYHKALNQYRIQHMYFLPTTACNFRCKYCFVEDEGRHQVPHFMDTSTAEAALIAFSKLSKGFKNPSITFYGGEPLLNPKTTFFSLRLIRQLEAEGKLAKGIRVSLLTNGSLVDAGAIRIFEETRPIIGVSIDGPQMLHDAARVDEHGQGTFQAALKGYRRFQDAGLNPGISCTLNPFTIEHIDEIVDFIINDLKPASMGFNLLLPQTGKKSLCSHFDYEFAVQQLIRAFERLREAGIYEDRVMRRVRPYMSQQMHFKDCMGVGGQIVVTPTGRIGPCQAFMGVEDNRYFPLDVHQLVRKGDALSSTMIYKEPLFHEWRHRFPLNMDKCADCFAISVCGGGCPYASAVIDGSIWEIDERVCYQAKHILEWMIWDTYEHMKGEGLQCPPQ